MPKTDCAACWIPDKIWERVPGHWASSWECSAAISVELDTQYGKQMMVDNGDAAACQ